MKSGWQKYLPYASIVIVGGFILFETVRLKNTGFEGKTLWDWMELLIIPAVLAGGVFFLNRSERAVEHQIAEDRAELEREIATDRQQEAALQSYLDRMADLLLKDKLLTTENEEVRNVARIRTLTVLRGLDDKRKRFVLQFLQESKLIKTPEPIVNLWGADLENANLQRVDLEGAVLRGVNLFSADIRFAGLQNADLRRANLNNANLSNANLSDANLERSNLRGAKLILACLGRTNLMYSHLVYADLRGADLEGASLDDAKSDNANFEGADLSGAIMPDGTIHE